MSCAASEEPGSLLAEVPCGLVFGVAFMVRMAGSNVHRGGLHFRLTATEFHAIPFANHDRLFAATGTGCGVYRVLPIAGFALASLALVGCAGTWDTITGRKFRTEPWTSMKHLVKPEDPMVILRSDPPRDGNERAKAMQRLKEPLANHLSQQDQDFVIDLLSQTAVKDSSPVLRLAAIGALGRFNDQRVPGILMLAYQKAHGRADGVPDPFRSEPAIQQAGGIGGRVPGRPAPALLQYSTPTGFLPETVEAIRCRTLEGIGRAGGPEAVRFLATIATAPEAEQGGVDDREVRLAAIRGLGKCRQPESVVALAQVLTTEKGKDTAIVSRAHAGLVSLTGKKLPPDPNQWNEVVQAGVIVVPEPTWVDEAVQTAAGWVKSK